tara:strand:- start:1561 stop:2088 length:528 start_codon:yes stop_codon:yes gene_type:complete
MGKMTDNLLQVVSVNLGLNGSSAVSSEMELDIPRGYVAKIHRIKMVVANWSADLFDLASADYNAQIAAVLMRDPDDSSTVNMPNNPTHDTLVHLYSDIYHSADTTGRTFFANNLEYDSGWIPESVDLITARNLRCNADVFGSANSDMDDAVVRYYVWFTYEKVTSSDLAELLQIL